MPRSCALYISIGSNEIFSIQSHISRKYRSILQKIEEFFLSVHKNISIFIIQLSGRGITQVQCFSFIVATIFPLTLDLLLS
jgi:hypothetical protein